MTKYQLYIALTVTALLGLTGCSKSDDHVYLGNVDHTKRTLETKDLRQIKVTSTDGKPVGQAQVLIGNSQNQPFADNFVTTDGTGNFTAPAGWNSEATVTISAPGFIRVSYLKQIPNGQTFQLRIADGPRNLELSGTTSGFNVVDKDGLVDFGLLIQGLSRQDLFNFNLGMVISPEIDIISILGQKLELPSNITLPKQKESYVLPITLDKPNYRMYFPSTGKKMVFAGRGQFPLKKVVDDLRAGKKFIELINYFTIGGGSLKSVEITGPKNTANLPVNELVFNQKMPFKSPVFDSDQVMVSLAMSEFQGSLFPTDVKQVESNQTMDLTTAVGGTPLLLTVLKKKSELHSGAGSDRLSATIMNLTSGAEPQALPLMKDPQIVSFTEIKADPVTTIAGVTPVASYAVLSTVEEISTGGNATMEVLNHLWEVYDPEWSTEFHLPTWPNDKPISGKKRWEVSRIGSGINPGKKLDLGPSMFDYSTHATHASADF